MAPGRRRGVRRAAQAIDRRSALDAREAALRRWAEQVTRDPNATTAAHVDALRAAGLSEREILEATLCIALRLAFSTVNDALGAQPDAELLAEAPPQVRAAVTYGRPPAAAQRARPAATAT